jgi:hypothetical protein
MIKERYNINVASVPCNICDNCFEGYHSGCEDENRCECAWTHYGPDWDELRKEKQALKK